MSIETLITDLIAALNRNSDNQDRLIAGQEAAMAKLEGATATTRKPRATKADAAEPAELAAAGNSEPESAPAATEMPAAAADSASDAAVFTPNDLKVVATKWRNSTEDADVHATQNAFLKSIAEHFGSPKLSGPDCTFDSDQVKQAIFFVKRKSGGLTVDFGADYDFDGSPKQETAAAAPVAVADPFADD